MEDKTNERIEKIEERIDTIEERITPKKGKVMGDPVVELN